ncbi:hypothetical protein ACFL47_08040 [Candidatus Latescibacterota bacterium]
MRKKEQPVTDNETFVRLIQAAQDDPEFSRQIIAILKLDSFNRTSLLGAFIDNMRMNGVAEDMIEALASLRDDDVAKTALRIIERNED